MKTILGLVSALVCAFACGAAQITSDQALEAAGNWLRSRAHFGCRLGRTVSGSRTCMTTNGAPFHVVTIRDGGFIVTSSDTDSEPIVAFSESTNLVENASNPLWVLLNRDFSARKTRGRIQHSAASSSRGAAKNGLRHKWCSLLPRLADGTNSVARLTHSSSSPSADGSSVSDKRVEPLIETRWSQEQDSLYSDMGDPCYNYYTPSNYPCGCVATAISQVMRYHRYPTEPVEPGSYNCRVKTRGHYRDVVLTMQGGVYSWDDMPLVPADGTTLVQRQAIGKLTSDVGISCLMSYASGGSSSAGYMASRALPERFHYANAIAYAGSGLPMSTVMSAIIPNLDAKLPVVIGMSGFGGGHAVVVDGYGYSMETFYMHINMGWAGEDDAWYAPPDMGDFSSIDSIVCNIFTTANTNCVICSGRVLSEKTGGPLASHQVSASDGVDVVNTTTDENGIYAFILKAGTYTIASSGSTMDVTLEANVGSEITDDGSYYLNHTVVGNQYDCDLTIPSDALTTTVFEVVFDLGSHGTRIGGGELTQSVEFGQKAVAPEFTVEEGWEFTGWDIAFGIVTSNMTVTAQYAESKPDDSDDPVNPLCAGSWTTDAAGAKAASDCELLVVLCANYGGCGWSQQAQTVFESETFLNWAASNGVYLITSDSSRLPAGSTNVTDASSYFGTLYYSVSHSDGYVYYPSIAIALPSNPDQAVGYSIVRNDGSRTVGGVAYDGTVQSLINGLSKYLADLPQAYVVSFDANGGSVGETNRNVVSGKNVGELPVAVREGWSFVGWFTETNGGDRVTAMTVIETNVTFHAQWTERNSWELSGIVGVSFSYDLEEFLADLGLGTGKCSLKKQPSGIKVDSNKGVLTGVPSKAGTYSMTVIDANKNEETVTFTVAALPDWAIGTFSGFVNTESGRGAATMTVGKNGKASGKFVVSGKTWSFAAASYDPESTLDRMVLVGTAKSGKVAREVRLEISGTDTSLKNGTAVGEMQETDDYELCELMLWRSVWKDSGAANLVSGLQGLYTVQVKGDGTGCGYLSLKVDAKGGVKATGKLPDGTSASATLTLVSGDGEGGDCFAVWTLAPSAYKGGSVTGTLNFGNESPRTISSDDSYLLNLSPTASGDYGGGFYSSLEVNGAYYGTTKALADYYDSLTVSAELEELEVKVKYTEYGDDDKKYSWTQIGAASSAVDPSGIELSVDASGKITAPSATKPYKEKGSSEWSYNGASDTAFKVTFAKATGIFKGSFTCWYDYISASDSTKENGDKQTYTSKKVSFEGIWVQGGDLQGYYLWDHTGSYYDERSNKEKTYKYKNSHLIELKRKAQ